jgi:hypothetical protein
MFIGTVRVRSTCPFSVYRTSITLGLLSAGCGMRSRLTHVFQSETAAINEADLRLSFQFLLMLSLLG